MGIKVSDAVVIGGGPVGGMAAAELAKNGWDVVLLEEHPRIGHPNHCSGLMASVGIKRLGFPIPADAVRVPKVARAKFYSPKGVTFTVDRRQEAMKVYDRARLDQAVVEWAEYHGARVLTQHKAFKAYRRHREVYIEGKYSKNGIKTSFSFKTRLVISAEGSKVKIAPQLGLPRLNYHHEYPGLQYEIEQVKDVETDTVELFFGEKWAPGFFGWSIPTSEESLLVGIAKKPEYPLSTKYLLDRFIKKHPALKKRLKGSKIYLQRGGLVPGHGPIKKTYMDNIMVAGDSAGQTKATTGGGFNIGGYCGKLAGQVGAFGLKINDVSEKFLSLYEKQWKSLFGRELIMMAIARRMLRELPDHVIDRAFEAAKSAGVEIEMQKANDVDLHGSALIKMAFKPDLLWWGVTSLNHLTKNVLKNINFFLYATKYLF